MPQKKSRVVPLDIVRKLGQASDRELAKLSGLSPYYIKQARLAAGIEAVSHGYDLSDELVQQLGKVPDARLTECYGVPGPVLCRVRQERSIPRFRVLHAPGSTEYVPFTDEAIALLGKIPDVDLAMRFDRSVREVKQERDIRAIATYTKVRNLPDDLVQELGLVPDSVLGRRYSVARSTITRAREVRSIPNFRSCKMLNSDSGTALDSHESKTSPLACRQPRRKLKFQNSHPANTPVLGIDSRIQGANRMWSEDEEALLGTAVDSKIADLLKVDFWIVFYRRKAMNIPAYEFAYS